MQHRRNEAKTDAVPAEKIYKFLHFLHGEIMFRLLSPVRTQDNRRNYGNSGNTHESYT
jgi:hypothetical protein